jgi:hypothetical protein
MKPSAIPVVIAAELGDHAAKRKDGAKDELGVVLCRQSFSAWQVTVAQNTAV